MDNKHTYAFTLSALIYVLFVGLLTFFSRLDLSDVITAGDFVFISSMLIVLLITPDILSELLSTYKKWYYSTEMVTFLIMGLLCFSGFFLIPNQYAVMSGSILTFIALLSIIYVLRKDKFSDNISLALIFSSIFIFISLLFFSNGYQSILFMEQTVLGVMHRDTIYHISIAEMLASSGVATTGLHGIEAINYHWGSHFLFAGLKGMVGLSAHSFYNYAYPVIFFPLLIKFILRFLNALSARIKLPEISIYLFFLAVPLLIITDVWRTAFMFSESTCIATLFLLIHSSIILQYIHEVKDIKLPFIIFSIIALSSVLFFKISTLFVYAPAIIWGYIKFGRSAQSLIISVISTFIFVILAYLFVYPVEMSSNLPDVMSLKYWIHTLLLRMDAFWSNPLRPIPQLSAILIAIIYYFKHYSKSENFSIIDNFKSNSSLLLEMLVVMNLFSIIPAVLLTLKPIDIYYFLYVQILFSTFYLLLLINKRILFLKDSKTLLLIFAALLFVLPFITLSGSTRLYFDDRGLKQVKEEMMYLTEEQQVLNLLISELSLYRSTLCDGKTAVYIPGDQDWYYKSQQFREHSSYFIVPAYSGCPLIGGLPEYALKKGLANYSFEYFTRLPDLPIHNLDEALNAAYRKDFDRLIVIKKVGSKLDTSIRILNQ